MSKTIVLIHGAWLNSKSWEGFKARYEAQGYTVVTPDWPYDDRDPAELRASPDPRLKTLSQRQIIAHLAEVIRAQPEEPILIGHSLGGVFVQHLLDMGLGVAGVAIDPAPTPGVGLGPQAIWSALPVFSDPFSAWKAKEMSRGYFKNRFAQTAPKDQADALYDRYIVPTPGRVYWNGVIGTIKIDWKNPNRAPLLLIGGEIDLIADASMTRAIYKKHLQSPVKTEYKEYAGRSHWTCMDAGWEEVADYALGWASGNARAPKVTPISKAA